MITMSRLASVSLALTLLGVSHRASTSSEPASLRADTLDVPVGSPLIDSKKMTAFTTHLQVRRGGDTALLQEATNSIVFGDSAGTPVVRVTSAGVAAGPNGKAPLTSHFTFDRRTLALDGMHNVSPRGEMSLRANGLSIEATMGSPAGPQTATVTLTAPAFFAQWSDYVVEELPRREGAVYRVRLWRMAPQPGGAPRLVEETHLYTMKRREDVTVFGKTHKQAWAVEDHNADGTALLGTMWIVDGPPKLVRWTINAPDGSAIQIDQELVPGR